MDKRSSGAALLAGLLCLAPLAASAARTGNAWADMARADADFIGDWARQQSISASYPSKDRFAAQLAAARRTLDGELSRVGSYEGYREALNHFVGSFQDRHMSVTSSLSPNSYQWPGFFAVYRGGRYVTAASAGAVRNGLAITGCDGKPMADWVHDVATYEQMIFGLESTDAAAAPLIFRDAGSPFIKRPQQCEIDGKPVTLAWQPIGATVFAKNVGDATVLRDRVTAITPFGADGAWVRLGIFAPATQEEGKAFRQVIDGAPALRDKSAIILDVRVNGGGPYEWFMGFLRSLYGSDYADYHARARLQISNVYRATPEILKYFNTGVAEETGALAPPPDGTPVDPDNSEYAKALRAGQTLFITPANARNIAMPPQLPANPVKAKVYVLTDYRCGSACIGFVDELKRFPGVEQIGVETTVDSRTGTPFGAPLPSGNGVIYVPTMTRDGRERGDNIAQKPDHVFDGNIADTAAVKAWITSTLLNQ